MKNDWLWDKNISDKEIKAALSNEAHPKFIRLAALLLARNNEPKKVFGGYLSSLVFYKNWNTIKKEMRKNKWDDQRIVFWQAVYEKIAREYKGRGVVVRNAVKKAADPVCTRIGNRLVEERKKKDLTQSALAKKIGISQQMLSRIETGRANLSISTINRIADKLGYKVEVDLK
ncbi:MAG: helix-turn-helix transcriptional regulator [Candidatus Margulisiibacteriota bacterium]